MNTNDHDLNDYINDDRVSADELAALSFLCASYERGEAVNISDIKKRFGWGDYKWRNVSHGLRTNMILSLARDQVGVKLRFNGLPNF